MGPMAVTHLRLGHARFGRSAAGAAVLGRLLSPAERHSDLERPELSRLVQRGHVEQLAGSARLSRK